MSAAAADEAAGRGRREEGRAGVAGVRGVLAPLLPLPRVLPLLLLLLSPLLPLFQLPPRETGGEDESPPAEASSGLVNAGVPACVPSIDEAASADALDVVRPMPTPTPRPTPPSPPPVPPPPPPQRWERSR